MDERKPKRVRVVPVSKAAPVEACSAVVVRPVSTGRCDMPHCLDPTRTHFMKSGKWRWWKLDKLRDARVKKICSEHVPPIMVLCDNCKNWCLCYGGLGTTRFRFRPAIRG